MIPSVVVLGLPEAGKSSFIAALSHILQFREIDTLLSLDHLSEEDKYVFEIRSLWQQCQPFARTGGGPVHPITLHLRNEKGFRGSVFFPDVIGEEFEEQWRGREWSADFTQAVGSASGLLLFINPITLEKPVSKIDVANTEIAILDAIGSPGEAETSASTDSEAEISVPASSTGEAIAREVATQTSEGSIAASDPTLWNPRDADSQVKVVDLLQAIASYGDQKRWTLGVVISAWDVVKNQMAAVTPTGWFARNCPLISQYLASNSNAFRFKVFGVSAQGGDPKEDAEKLRAYDSQSERVQVVCEDYQGHDLTRVLLWAMEP